VGGSGKSELLLTLRHEYESQDEAYDSELPGKASREINMKPYRKLTQVDEERILR
jgi:hypothetical protein